MRRNWYRSTRQKSPVIAHTGLRKNFLQALDEAVVERIHSGELQLLQMTDVIFHDEQILARLHGEGCRIEARQRVYIRSIW